MKLQDQKWSDQFDVYPIDGSVIDGLDWAIVIGGAVGTIICAAAFFYWIFKLLAHLWAANAGKVAMNDPVFWKRMGIGLIILMVLMSGLWLLIIERMFDEINQSLKGWYTK
ncbi:hypothetical protein D3P09_02705 [Paenibacillus pinisoli]|uniref:Uncharacterized protein n=1 Tax=Paenibacillus pinisoli TaxID=1276110 RepID=A0A3A6PMI5_9BACL|nr:hypothetical protein [Paenibacillus pinisoli]RJX40946.1 hypothetical protein D3P09_02705 [Paenibacillus pinisoli]